VHIGRRNDARKKTGSGGGKKKKKKSISEIRSFRSRPDEPNLVFLLQRQNKQRTRNGMSGRRLQPKGSQKKNVKNETQKKGKVRTRQKTERKNTTEPERGHHGAGSPREKVLHE